MSALWASGGSRARSLSLVWWKLTSADPGHENATAWYTFSSGFRRYSREETRELAASLVAEVVWEVGRPAPQR